MNVNHLIDSDDSAPVAKKLKLENDKSETYLCILLGFIITVLKLNLCIYVLLASIDVTTV